MYQFNLSAPGTVFLSGDSVKEYKTIVAASLDMRTKLSFNSLLPADRPSFIEINFSRTNFDMKIPLDKFLKCFYHDNSYRTLSDTLLHNAIRTFVPSLLIFGKPKPRNHQEHQLSLEAFFYLLLSIAFKENINIESSFIVKVSTELPIGEGLGSSASFIVSVAACFWRWSLLQKGTVRNEFNNEDLVAILDYARCCDSIIFNSSEVINTNVSVYGSITCYQDLILHTRLWLRFSHLPSIKILLVLSSVNKIIITAQRQTTRSSPHYNKILDYIDKVSMQITQVLHDDEKTYTTDHVDNSNQTALSKQLYEKLSSLIKLKQDFLKATNMSHSNLDTICTIAQKFSLSGKQMDGGRYVFILLPPDITDETISQILREFNSFCFRAIVTNISCSGVRLE